MDDGEHFVGVALDSIRAGLADAAERRVIFDPIDEIKMTLRKLWSPNDDTISKKAARKSESALYYGMPAESPFWRPTQVRWYIAMTDRIHKGGPDDRS